MIFYARHGCFPEERTIGNKFVVDFSAQTDMSLPSKTDDLEDAVNYQSIYDIIAQEMAIPSSLLENVAGRIIERVKKEFPAITSASVSVSKINPPLGGEVGASKVTLSY